MKLVNKNLAVPCFFNVLPGVWKSDETIFLVLNISHLEYNSNKNNIYCCDYSARIVGISHPKGNEKELAPSLLELQNSQERNCFNPTPL